MVITGRTDPFLAGHEDQSAEGKEDSFHEDCLDTTVGVGVPVVIRGRPAGARQRPYAPGCACKACAGRRRGAVSHHAFLLSTLHSQPFPIPPPGPPFYVNV